MEDFIKSIKAFLYDRASSPLFGAFAIAWSIWNYKFYLIIFSDNLKYQEKVAEIDKAFSIIHAPFFNPTAEHSFHSGLNSLIIPALLSLFYIYLYPLLAKPIYKYALKIENEIRGLKQDADNKKLLSEKESAEIFLQLARAEEKTSKEAEAARKKQASLLTEIEHLEKEIRRLEKENRTEVQQTKAPQNNTKPTDEPPTHLDPENHETTNEDGTIANKDELFYALENAIKNKSKIPANKSSYKQAQNILIFLSNSFGTSISNICQSTSINKTKAESLLNILEDAGFISVSQSSTNGTAYRITKSGGDYLLKADLI